MEESERKGRRQGGREWVKRGGEMGSEIRRRDVGEEECKGGW